MRGGIAVLVLALVGLFGATSIGYAAYLVSRDSVGLPVTKLQHRPNAPAAARATTRARTTKPMPSATTTRTTTVDDHGGRAKGSGKGSDDSSRGGGDD